MMVSQLFPGKEPGESFTVQNFLVDRELSPEQREAATRQFEFLKGVVRDECWRTVVARTIATVEEGGLPLRAVAVVPEPTPSGNREAFLLLRA